MFSSRITQSEASPLDGPPTEVRLAFVPNVASIRAVLWEVIWNSCESAPRLLRPLPGLTVWIVW